MLFVLTGCVCGQLDSNQLRDMVHDEANRIAIHHKVLREIAADEQWEASGWRDWAAIMLCAH